jgi:hypothetical protein
VQTAAHLYMCCSYTYVRVISFNLMSSPRVFVIRRLADTVFTKSDQGDASSTPNNIHLDPRSQHIDAELSRACHLALILVRLSLSVPPYYEAPGSKLFSSSMLHHRVGPAQFRVIDVVSIRTLLVDKGSIHVRNMGVQANCVAYKVKPSARCARFSQQFAALSK